MIRARREGRLQGGAATVALLACLVSAAAVAQDTASAGASQPAPEGAPAASSAGGGNAPPGFKVGDGRLHLIAEVDGRYDSLVGFFNRQGGRDIPSSDIIVHFRPGLAYELGNQSTLVNFRGTAEYLLFTGVFDPATRNLSRFQGNVNLDLAFFRDGPVELQLGDTFARSDRTQNVAAGVGVISWQNEARLALAIRPGGRAIELTPRVAWAIEFFEPLLGGTVTGCPANDPSCTPAAVAQMSFSNLQFGLTGRWKFLPKTFLVVDGSFDWRTYWQGQLTGGARPASILRGLAGISGLITPKLNVTLLAGAAGDLVPLSAFRDGSMNAAPTATTFVARAEVGFSPSQFINTALGYDRSLQPVPVFGVVGSDRIYATARVGLLAGRLTFDLNAAATLLSFYAASRGSDWLINVNPGVTFFIVPWLSVGAQYSLGYRLNNGNLGATQPALFFLRHEALLRLSLTY